MKLSELAAGIGNISGAESSLEINTLCTDSRKVVPGCLFAALPGSNVDGLKFVDDAISAGASAVLVEEDRDIGQGDIAVIRAQDPRLALSQMAARLYPSQPATMMAVTGTAGKTSVAEFLRQIWQHCGHRAAFIGTTGVVAPGREDYGNLTTPDPVTLHQLLDELAKAGVSHGAMEASSHGLEQRRLHGVKLAAAGFTNLGHDHLDYHKTVEEYFLAKAQLFSDLLEAGSPAVLFSDDPYSERMVQIAKNAELDVRTVGRDGNYLQLKRVEHGRHSQTAELEFENRLHRLEFPLAGDFQLANGLVAAGLALSGGEAIEEVLVGLSALKGASGRLEMVGRSKQGAPVYVDYAHKPEALENVLSALRPFASRDLVLVFGCGGDRDKAKRPVMGEIAQRLADKVIVTDDNPRGENAADVRRAILEAAPKAIEIGDRGTAIREAIGDLKEGDCLVIAGKGHESGQIVGNKVLEFSDHLEARKSLGVET